MRIIVLNASRNSSGNSAHFAKEFLGNRGYNQINLSDYFINQTGQHYKGDQLNKVIKPITGSDILVITTPTYWSSMPGYLKTFIDRSGNPMSSKFSSIKVFLLMQGTAPSDAIKPTAHVINHWATRDGMTYMGVASTSSQLRQLKNKLK